MTLFAIVLADPACLEVVDGLIADGSVQVLLCVIFMQTEAASYVTVEPRLTGFGTEQLRFQWEEPLLFSVSEGH